jgi:aryl-alcohol dehydrogenase-like predicted oxidoreductase
MSLIQHDFDTEPMLTPREIDATGVRVFPIGFDGSVLGWVTGPDMAREVLEQFRAMGGNLVSTADHYAGGRSEIMIGEWLRSTDRGQVIVATKVGRHPDSPGLHRSAILQSVDASLERLGTDYVDLLSFDGDLLGPDPGEAFATVGELIAAGKVRFLSAAHFSADRLRELTAIAQSGGHPTFRAGLAEYNLLVRSEFEAELVPAAADLGMALFARLPLASGFLSGEVRSKTDLPANPLFDGALQHVGRRGFKVLDALAVLAAEHGTTSAGIALAWVLSRPGVTAAIVRINDLGALHDGLIGSSIQLTRHQLATLDEASRR